MPTIVLFMIRIMGNIGSLQTEDSWLVESDLKSFQSDNTRILQTDKSLVFPMVHFIYQDMFFTEYYSIMQTGNN